MIGRAIGRIRLGTLLPSCPFCGGASYLVCGPGGDYFVVCNDKKRCGAEGPTRGYPMDAVHAWATRFPARLVEEGDGYG